MDTPNSTSKFPVGNLVFATISFSHFGLVERPPDCGRSTLFKGQAMILDRLENTHWYRNLHPLFGPAFDYLATAPLADLPAGKQTIQGEQLFALVNDYTTQPAEKCRFETHRRYADIQLVVRGVEQIGVANLADMTIAEPYSAERDVTFFQGHGDQITLAAGTFAIFFPQDAHQPGIALAEPVPARKVVVKVLLGERRVRSGGVPPPRIMSKF
jgi:YhcH/YjgK/YiaL family protein